MTGWLVKSNMTGWLVKHYRNLTTIPRTPLQRPQGSMLEGANIHVNRMARPEGSMLVGQTSKLKRNVDGANAWDFLPQTLHSMQFNTYWSHLYHQNQATPQFLVYTCNFILATKFGTAGPQQSPVKWGIKEVKGMKQTIQLFQMLRSRMCRVSPPHPATRLHGMMQKHSSNYE
jgi:hypothetical protein